MRSSRRGCFKLLSIEFEKSSIYASRENWYIGSMRPMSFITKNRIAARREHGRYPCNGHMHRERVKIGMWICVCT